MMRVGNPFKNVGYSGEQKNESIAKGECVVKEESFKDGILVCVMDTYLYHCW